MLSPIFYAIYSSLYDHFFFTFCVFLYMIMELLNIDNHSKTLLFKKFKRLLYIYIIQNLLKYLKNILINLI